MSRIGKKIITIPENVDLSFKDGVVSVSCSEKSMSLEVGSDFYFIINDSVLEIRRSSDEKEVNP